MTTTDVLLALISLLGVLILIGLVLCLMVIARLNRLTHEVKQIYGQENDIKKRIEQYVARKASDELAKLIFDYREGLETQSKTVVQAMKEGIDLYMESLKKFIFGQEAQITKQTEYILGAIVKNAQGEIETYKKNQMEGIDEEVREIVAKVAPDVLGKSINFDDHEDLVWKALEKAKREGLFVKGAILSKELAEASKVPTVAKKSSKKPKRKKK